MGFCPTSEKQKKEKQMNVDIIVPISLFIAAAFVIYFYMMTRHREKMLLFEKDVSMEDIKKLYTKPRSGYNTAKWALIFLFGGSGLFIGIWLSEMTGEDGYAPAAVILFVGLGLLVWQKLYGSKEEDDS